MFRRAVPVLVVLLAFVAPSARPPVAAQALPELLFDHIHTYAEASAYVQAVAKAYPQITKLHTIGKSFLGKDLLVLEITNRQTGDGVEKPGYWIDGNLHAGEVFGGEATLHTIRALVTGYKTDPVITDIVDTKVFYIMPKLNPDGSDHVITKPDNLRSVVRPFDEDNDGTADEDPAEDLNGDGYISTMRVRDPNGTHRTSPEDRRLMVPRTTGREPADWKGEWRLLTEGIDNDGDGQFNEDGVGGIDINRNFPNNWQPDPISTNPGPFPLSEPESRAVVEFIASKLPNLTGSINYHMTGNVAVFPPSNLHTDPVTGDKVPQPFEDEATYKRFGAKIQELDDVAKVQVFRIHGASPASASGSIWGVLADWMYYQQGAFGWIFEYGINPGAKELFPSSGREIDRLRWSDENGGKLFLDWKPFTHPQLGPVELGGFLQKIYEPKYKTYISTQTLPGPNYERQLAAHTKWHLFLISQAPHIGIADVQVKPATAGYATVTAVIENQGPLPTYVTKQAIVGEIAKTVKATLTLSGATLVGGRTTVDLGHLEGTQNRAASRATAEWVVRTDKPGATVTIKAVSQKGGTATRTVDLAK